MNRRQLFAALAGAVALPGELWTPSRKIFLPPQGGWPVVLSEMRAASGWTLRPEAEVVAEQILAEMQDTWNRINAKVDVIRTPWGRYAVVPEL